MILFKNNYYEEDEKLFSTGDSELDNILEEVYYSGIEDGYDYFQKEFAEEDKKKDGRGRTIAAGTVAAGGAALALGSKKIPEKAINGLSRSSDKFMGKWMKYLEDPNKTADQAEKFYKKGVRRNVSAAKIYENSGKISKNLKRAGIGLAAAGVGAGIANEIIRRKKQNHKLED